MNPQSTLSLNRFYCLMMAVIQFSCVAIVLYVGSQFSGMVGTPPDMKEVFGVDFIKLFTILFLPALFGGFFSFVLIFAPRTKFWWWAHLFHQIMGLGTCVFFAIPLLIFWSREPLMEIYFGRAKITRRRRRRASR